MMKRLAIGLLFALLGSAALAQNPGVAYRGANPAANDCVKFVNRTLVTTTGAPCFGGAASFANPTASVGLTAVNGVATTAMRSDAAPPLDVTAAYAFSGLGATRVTANGALSSGAGPAFAGTGTWITGGTATTTKPYALIEPAGTTSTAWSTNGTGFGVNAAAGFTGSIFDFQLAGASQFKLTNSTITAAVTLSTQDITAANNKIIGWSGQGGFNSSSDGGVELRNNGRTNKVFLTAAGATATPILQIGDVTGSGAAVAQTITVQGSSGNSAAAALFTIAGSDQSGTTTTGGGVKIRGGNGTTAGGTVEVWTSATTTPAVAISVAANKTSTFSGPIVTTGYTVAGLPAAPGTGARAHVTDALNAAACTFFAVVVAGGTTNCPVFYNGAGWVGG